MQVKRKARDCSCSRTPDTCVDRSNCRYSTNRNKMYRKCKAALRGQGAALQLERKLCLLQEGRGRRKGVEARKGGL